MQENNRILCHPSEPHQTEIFGHSQRPGELSGLKPRRHSRGMEK